MRVWQEQSLDGILLLTCQALLVRMGTQEETREGDVSAFQGPFRQMADLR